MALDELPVPTEYCAEDVLRIGGGPTQVLVGINDVEGGSDDVDDTEGGLLLHCNGAGGCSTTTVVTLDGVMAVAPGGASGTAGTGLLVVDGLGGTG
mmetsp:Transcript_72639/g.135714  ORF Transcript_72639/g.135714 Transcript_72639/m.135714 type:complete len:96 (+) Transcript_72639:286-573(+)